jgi:hypothetical protein
MLGSVWSLLHCFLGTGWCRGDNRICTVCGKVNAHG